MKRKARVYAPMKGFGREETDYEEEKTEEVPRRRDPILAARCQKN